MTALLLKDYYTLIKQAKLFILIIFVFAFIPGDAVVLMATVYAAMLPMTSLAYDERAKWDSLAAMMPYSVRDIVLGKYLIGYGGILIVSVISIATNTVRNMAFDIDAFTAQILAMSVAAILIALNLPIMIRFGVEKGRLAFIAMFGIIGGLTVVVSNYKANSIIETTMGNQDLITVAAAVIIAVVINVISVILSMAWYKYKAENE